MASPQAATIESLASPETEPSASPAGGPAPSGDDPGIPRAGSSTGSDASGAPHAESSASAGAWSPAPLEDIIAWQEKIFTERQPESRRMAAKAATALAGGVTSSWQITRPQPVWLSHGRGSKIYDVDGTEYVDLHGGYGAALAGHGHPAIVEAVRGQITVAPISPSRPATRLPSPRN